jgi:hypothetical protein
MASINCLMNRVHTYPITNEEKTKELNIIQDTLYNNEYNKNLSTSHSGNLRHKKYKPTTPNNKMGHFYVLQKRNKQISRPHSEQNTIQNLVKPRLQ